MKRTTAACAFAVIALVAVTGCTASSEPTLEPTASSTPTRSALDPQQALDAALDQARTAAAVSFQTRTISQNGERTATADTDGVWVSTPASWETSTNFQVAGFGGFPGAVRFVDTRLYVATGFSGASPSGWVDVTDLPPGPAGFNPLSSTPGGGPRPPALDLLYRIDPTAVTDTAGTTIITGTIPNRLAIETLGLAGYISGLGLPGAFDEGQTTVRLTLAPSGFPARLDILGADINATSPDIPDYRREELGGSSYRSDYRPMRRTPDITAPVTR